MNNDRFVLGSIFLVLLAGIAGQTAFADHSMVDVTIPEGTSVPGCEETNECYVPYKATVDVGGEVTWTNKDTAGHTVTSGNPQDGPSGHFDSGLFPAGQTFTHKFEETGTFDYFCMVHPWMQGIVTVQEAMAEEPKDNMGMMEKSTMSGSNVELTVDPLPFDKTKSDTVKLSFKPTASQLKGADITPGKIDHLDYKITVMKNGKQVWSNQFHDHDGNLELQIAATGTGGITGGKENQQKTMTGPYQINQAIFKENGDYTIKSEIVGIEFNPLPEPLSDEFSIKVVPEFGTYAILALVTSIIGILIFTTKNRQLVQRI